MDTISDVQQAILCLAIVVCLGASLIVALSDLEKVRSSWIENRRDGLERLERHGALGALRRVVADRFNASRRE
jgi:hypothetical protein